jgi:hypothetical protein
VQVQAEVLIVENASWTKTVRCKKIHISQVQHPPIVVFVKIQKLLFPVNRQFGKGCFIQNLFPKVGIF